MTALRDEIDPACVAPCGPVKRFGSEAVSRLDGESSDRPSGRDGCRPKAADGRAARSSGPQNSSVTAAVKGVFAGVAKAPTVLHKSVVVASAVISSRARTGLMHSGRGWVRS